MGIDNPEGGGKQFDREIEKLKQPDRDARIQSMTLRECMIEIKALEEVVVQRMDDLMASYEKKEISQEEFERRLRECDQEMEEIALAYERLKKRYDSFLPLRTNN